MGLLNQYVIQLYGFIVKTFVQRYRMPITTIVEVLLPCLFVLLLSISYWCSTSETVPAQLHEGGSTVSINMTNFASYFVCNMPGATVTGPWSTCNLTTTPIYSFKCLSLVGSGRDLCSTYANYGALSGILYSMYYGSGPFGLNTFDGHLTLSAMVTELTKTDNPTFFGRGGRSSLSHFGKLVISSDSAAVADEFKSFCAAKSSMCSDVLYETSFSSLEDAKAYAVDEENTVWAIVHLPSSSMNASAEDPEFTISMNFTATASTASDARRSLFTRGTGNNDGGDGYVLYWASGFMTLQTFVHEFYLQRWVQTADMIGPALYYANSTTEGVSKYLTVYGSNVIPMPTAEYLNNSFLSKWAYYVPLIAVMAVLFPTSRLVSMIVVEKFDGIREAMLVMGLMPSCMFFGWYLSALLMDLVASLLAAMFLKIGFMKQVNYGILLLMYFSFMQQNTALCFFVSSLFTNPRIASWCVAFVLFVCAIPSYSFPEGMTDLQKTFVCLVPCVGYAETFNMILQYVNNGWHFGLAEAQTGGFDVSRAIGMMWASFGVLMLLSFYLDRVGFGAVGRRAHPLFFLMPLFNMFRTRKSVQVSLCDSGRPIQQRRATASEYGDDVCRFDSDGKVAVKDISGDSASQCSDMIEHHSDVVDTSDPGIALLFHRLRKVYISGGLLGYFYTFFTGMFRRGDRVVALDGVTFAIRTGEVNVLLGPNGAGKSTIMGIATGMVSATQGSVYISGHNTKTDIESCRQSIGYCPQRDIVWPLLTVEEHITFYARMKASESFNVQEKVNYVIDLVGLEEKRNSTAHSLSGGQRRRLCVAMALVGDSTVLLLDEPTAGMDIRGRMTVYDALRRARAHRSVLISTHLLDEADRIADRVLVVHKGTLHAEGTTAFLKSRMKVGYIVTCVLDSTISKAEEDAAAVALIDYVRREGHHGSQDPALGGDVPGRGPECSMLGVVRRGRQLSFRFPSALLGTSGVPLLSLLQANRFRFHLRDVGLSLTTLEDVFFTVTQTCSLMSGAAEGEAESLEDLKMSSSATGDIRVAERSDLYELNKSGFAVFCRHFRALFLKRLQYAQRDVKLLMFQVVLPVVFLLLSLFMNLVRAPSQPSLRLDMSMYSDYSSSEVMMAYSDFSGYVQGLTRYPIEVTNAFQIGASVPGEAFGKNYLSDFREMVSGLPNVSYPMGELLMDELMTHEHARLVALAPVGGVYQQGAPQMVSTILHNSTANHAAPQAVNTLYHLATYQLFGSSVTPPTTVNSPMGLGEFESNLVSLNKQVMIGIFIILPFIFIPSNTIAYIVEEKESGVRSIQWLSGVNIFAYWLSSFVFDALCYIVTQILAFIIFVIFDRTEYTGKGMLAPSLVLFLFYGVSSVPVSYFLSFFFKSAFTAQSVVFCLNFTLGFLWVTIESMIAPNALIFVKVVTFVVRVLPSVCFGEGLFVIAGRQLARLMSPTKTRASLFALLSFTDDGDFSGGIGTGLIYMSCVMVGSIIGIVVLEYVRLRGLGVIFTRWCSRENPKDAECFLQLAAADASVGAEMDRVCADKCGPDTDGIVLQHLNKRYFGARHAAVEDVSFGVRGGETMALLGLNGAGKSTMMGILTGEVAATSGGAFVNGISVTSMASRSFIGYCPQKDALLSNLSAEEHMWLYARLRGVREKYIAVEVSEILLGLGLHPFRKQAAGSLSGGNKRRLSLAIALVGRTTSVLLDEPTSGMDAIARTQTCEMLRSLTQDRSVMLTTHLLDEVEAMADRVAFVVRGSLRCIGTPLELKNKYSHNAVYTLSLQFPSTVDLQGSDANVVETVRAYVEGSLRSSKRGSEDADMKAGYGEESLCTIGEVSQCVLQLSVRGDLSAICGVLSFLQDSKVDGVPPATYVKATQPTLEDILLLQ